MHSTARVSCGLTIQLPKASILGILAGDDILDSLKYEWKNSKVGNKEMTKRAKLSFFGEKRRMSKGMGKMSLLSREKKTASRVVESGEVSPHFINKKSEINGDVHTSSKSNHSDSEIPGIRR